LKKYSKGTLGKTL